MSTVPKKEVAFIQENQNTVEHSALLYLFQEVSKLDPPVHTGFLDTNSPSKWLNEMSRKRHSNHKKEDEYSLRASRDTHKYSLSCMLPCNRVENASEENGDVSEPDEPRCECSSPWKVLSLINLTCERLLHQKDVDEENSTSESSSTKSCQSAATSASAPPNGMERESEGDGLDWSLEPKKMASAVPVEDLKLDCPGDSQQLQFCGKDADESCDVHPAGKTEPVTSEMQEDCSVVSLQPLCRSRKEFSIIKHLDLNQGCKEEGFSTKKDHLVVPFLEKETQSPTCLKAEMTSSSGYNTCACQSKPALTLDHNANITLSVTQLLPPSVSVLSSQTAPLTAESWQSLSGQTSGSKYHQTSTEDANPAANQLNCSSCDICLTASTPELWTGQTKEPDPPPPPLQRPTKSRRKQPHPSRSTDIHDPDFQGVMFRIDMKLDDTREQCRLLITSKYSKELRKAARKRKLRARTSQKLLKTSSSDEESDLTANATKNKVCASCCTRKTPMWRDAEDGTPLCNACGIRYKKYKVRCVNCWHIPRKEGNSNSRCLKCGNFVKPTSARQKHSS